MFYSRLLRCLTVGVISITFFARPAFSEEDPSLTTHLERETAQENIQKEVTENTSLKSFIGADKSAFWGRQWEKLRLKINVKTPLQEVEIGSGLFANLRLLYRGSSQPAFVKGKHQRLDVWEADANLSYPKDHWALGSRLLARLTFARFFDSKVESLVIPSWPWRTPLNSDQALDRMNQGDLIRLELSSNPSFSTSQSSGGTGNDLTGAASLSLSRGAHFLVDLYRVKNDKFRIRMIANRSGLETGVSVGSSIPNAFESVSGFLGDHLRRWFTCSPFQFSASTNLLKSTPVDSMMADFLFDLKDPEGKLAFDELMEEILSFRFFKYLNFIYSHKELGEALNGLIKDLDSYRLRFIDIAPNDRPVHRLFKGRAVTRYQAFELNSKCFKIWDFRPFSIRNSRSEVRAFDEMEKAEDFTYFTSSTLNSYNYLGNLYGESQKFSANALFSAKRLDSEESVVNEPTQLTDLIIVRDFTDLEHDPSEVKHMKAYMKYAFPTIADRIDWRQFNQSNVKHNAFFQLRWVFGSEFVKHLRISPEYSSIDQQFESYLSGFPKREYLPAPNENDHMKNEWDSKYDPDIRIISKDLRIITTAQTTIAERVDAFRRLQKNELFQHIGPGFLVSMLPESKLTSLTGVRLLGEASGTEPVYFSEGRKEPSEIYSSIEFLLAAIEDRSIDLRLRLNEAKNQGDCDLFNGTKPGTTEPCEKK